MTVRWEYECVCSGRCNCYSGSGRVVVLSFFFVVGLVFTGNTAPAYSIPFADAAAAARPRMVFAIARGAGLSAGCGCIPFFMSFFNRFNCATGSGSALSRASLLLAFAACTRQHVSTIEARAAHHPKLAPVPSATLEVVAARMRTRCTHQPRS